MKKILTLYFLLVFTSLFSQNFSISGTLKDASNGETVIGANVYIKELNNLLRRSIKYMKKSKNVTLKKIIQKYNKKTKDIVFSIPILKL